MAVGTETKSPFVIRVTADAMTATISAELQTKVDKQSATEIVTELHTAKIAINDEVRQRVAEYLESLRAPDRPPTNEFVIATGRPPTEGHDGALLWDESLRQNAADWADDGPIDFYNISSITTVEADTLIGVIEPPRTGINGIDVHGQPLRPQYTPQAVTLGNGIRLEEDGRRVFAEIPGRVMYEDLALSMDEVVEIRGDVDFETGNLDLSIDGFVNGSIRDLFQVKASKNLTVGGAIEAADVNVAGNVTVRGGILTHHGKGKVVAGGEVVAKFCEESDVRAAGDIRISAEAMNCHIHTERKLILPRGSVIGGSVFAREGLEANTLGSEAGAPTEITVGLHPGEVRRIRATASENAKRRRKAAKIHQILTPLMAQIKRLTNEQREKATELLYQAAAIEAEVDKAETDAAALLEASRNAKPYVLVSSEINERVSITIDDRVVTFSQALKGPVRIEVRKIKNYSAIVAVNQLTGSIHELPARELELPQNPADNTAPPP